MRHIQKLSYDRLPKLIYSFPVHFWDDIFFDEKSIIQVIFSPTSHPQCPGFQIGPYFNPILYGISERTLFCKKPKTDSFIMFSMTNFICNSITYWVP